MRLFSPPTRVNWMAMPFSLDFAEQIAAPTITVRGRLLTMQAALGAVELASPIDAAIVTMPPVRARLENAPCRPRI